MISVPYSKVVLKFYKEIVMSGNNDGPKGLSKITLAFFGTFFSLLLAFIIKDYFLKSYYVWCTQDETNKRAYISILKQTVDDDVFKRIRVADDNVSIEKNQSKNQPTSSNKEHLRMQSLLNNLEPIE
jgi:hypothetical protein